MNEPRESYQGAIKIVVLAFVLALALGTLEIALRLMPSTIGLTALSKFEPGLIPTRTNQHS